MPSPPPQRRTDGQASRGRGQRARRARPFIPRGARNPPAGASASGDAHPQRASLSEEERLEARRREILRGQTAAAALRTRLLAEVEGSGDDEGSSDEDVSTGCLHSSFSHLYSSGARSAKRRKVRPTPMTRPTTSMRGVSRTGAGESPHLCPFPRPRSHPSRRRPAGSASGPSAQAGSPRGIRGRRGETKLRGLAVNPRPRLQETTRTENLRGTSLGNALPSLCRIPISCLRALSPGLPTHPLRSSEPGPRIA